MIFDNKSSCPDTSDEENLNKSSMQRVSVVALKNIKLILTSRLLEILDRLYETQRIVGVFTGVSG